MGGEWGLQKRKKYPDFKDGGHFCFVLVWFLCKDFAICVLSLLCPDFLVSQFVFYKSHFTALFPEG